MIETREITVSNHKIFSIVSLFFVASCESQFYSTEDCKEQEESIQNIAFEVHGRLWDTKDVSVCWEDKNVLSEDEREYLQNIVYEGWDKQIGLNFVGWKLCSQTEMPNVLISNLTDRIHLDNGGPNTYTGSTSDIGMPPTRQSFVDIKFSSCDFAPNKNICLRHIILHEFGHVLNLEHTQTRSDTPEWCQQIMKFNNTGTQSTIEENGQLIGPFDMESVMNYCSPLVDKPSCWDITQVKRMYE